MITNLLGSIDDGEGEGDALRGWLGGVGDRQHPALAGSCL